ncbi:hypothetical protein BcDW1_7159 [Botrytis cinerea BcDW1]|uniref:Uncharacterized protein n=1 Tax=Botryotinia fuckeliana (strain BcDW1) TaxID=1290391 RepID=M7TKV1_BOTF1|nr:hypothetical protein BcDW1_7159 [Botrytis cinerea BcDW1]
MAQQPTYLLAPNFHFKPGTGPIALGNIIVDPLRPHRALTTVDASTLKATYPRVEMILDHNRSMSRGSSREMSIAVWAQFVQTVGTKVSGERGASIRNHYTMDTVETTYFVADPPLEEIETRLKAPRVQAVIKAGSIFALRQPVYMVTGLMIAKGFSILQESGLHSTGVVEVSGNAPTPAGNVGLGANLAKSTNTDESDTWKAGENIVFAYQLLKIEIKGWKGTKIKYDELRHKAAYLSKDDEDDDEDDDKEDEDEITGHVTTSVASVNNISISHGIGGLTTVQLGEGESKITCISLDDMQHSKD